MRGKGGASVKREDYIRAVALGAIAAIVLAGLLVASLANWAPPEVSRVIVAGLAALLLVMGVLPRGPGQGGAAAVVVAVSSELAGWMVANG